MAVGAPYSLATTAELTTTTSDASITTNVAAAAGDTLFLWCASRLIAAAIYNAISWTGISGTPEFFGHKHSVNAEGIGVARLYLPSGLASGTVITGTLDAAPTRKTVGCFAVPRLSGANADSGIFGSEGTTGAPTGGSIPAPSIPDAIFLSFFQHNTTAATETGTAGTGWTMVPGQQGAVGASSWSAGFVEYLIASSLTASGAPTYTPSLTTTTAWAQCGSVWTGIPATQVVNRTMPMRRIAAPVRAAVR